MWESAVDQCNLSQIHILRIDGNQPAGDRQVKLLEKNCTAGESRYKNLSRSKRKPSHQRRRAKGHEQVWALNKCDQCRRENGMYDKESRCPTPGSVEKNPAAVMKRRESPRCIVYPGPAPRLDPRPMSVLIGRPVSGHSVRRPNGTVFWIRAPLTAVFQLLGSRHLLRHILR